MNKILKNSFAILTSNRVCYIKESDQTRKTTFSLMTVAVFPKHRTVCNHMSDTAANVFVLLNCCLEMSNMWVMWVMSFRRTSRVITDLYEDIDSLDDDRCSRHIC